MNIPKVGTKCKKTHCVYNTRKEMCFTPSENKERRDSLCFRWSEKKLLKKLTIMDK